MGPTQFSDPPKKPIALHIGIDSSASVEPDSLKQERSNLKQRLSPYLLKHQIVPDYFFLNGKSPVFVSEQEIEEQLYKEKGLSSPIYRSLMDVLALRTSEKSHRYIVLSDGNDTERSIDDLRNFALQPVWWVPLKSRTQDLMFVRALQIPKSALTNQQVSIEALVESKVAGKATIRLLENEKEIESRPVQLQEGLNLFDLAYENSVPGRYMLTLVVEPEAKDPIPGNNSARATLRVFDQNSILLVAQETGDAKNLQMLIEGMNIGVKTVSSEEFKDLPLEGYSAILLIDTEKSALNQSLEDRIRDYVLNGGGFGVLGGKRSFGLGGWFRSTLEEVMPVFCPPRSYRRSVAMLLIIDSSGSMLAEDAAIWSDPQKLMRFLATASDQEKPIYVAKQAAKQVLSELLGIEVGVLNFSDNVSVAVPLMRVTEGNLPYLVSGIDSIQAGGGTRFHPALTGGLSMVSGRGYQEVHMILFSDGVPSDRAYLPDILTRLKQEKVNLSTIAFGKGAAVSLLRSMAEETGGKFYASDSMTGMKGVFEQAVERVFGPPVRTGEILTQVHGSQNLIEDADKLKLPLLKGIVSTSPKERAEIILLADMGEPLLALWQFGLGQSFVWTSDVSGQWSSEWMGTDAFAQVFSRLIAKILRREHDPMDFRTSIDGNQLQMRLRAIDEEGNYMDNLSVSAEIRADSEPDRIVRQMDLSFSGDGEYASAVSLPQSGSYTIRLQVSGSGADWEHSTRVEVPVDTELSFKGENEALFLALTKDNGASVLNAKSPLEPIFLEDAQTQSVRSLSYASYPLALAIFLLCVEVLLRRSRVLDQISTEKIEDEARKRNLCQSYLDQARASLKHGETKDAEKFYLAAHRTAKQLNDPSLLQAVWQEYRAKI